MHVSQVSCCDMNAGRRLRRAAARTARPPMPSKARLCSPLPRTSRQLCSATGSHPVDAYLESGRAFWTRLPPSQPTNAVLLVADEGLPVHTPVGQLHSSGGSHRPLPPAVLAAVSGSHANTTPLASYIPLSSITSFCSSADRAVHGPQRAAVCGAGHRAGAWGGVRRPATPPPEHEALPRSVAKGLGAGWHVTLNSSPE